MNEKYCKKCGRPLSVDSKHNKCENCRTKSAQRAKSVGKTVAMGIGVVGSLALAVATNGKFKLPKR